jgi:hypothetical protein
MLQNMMRGIIRGNMTLTPSAANLFCPPYHPVIQHGMLATAFVSLIKRTLHR